VSSPTADSGNGANPQRLDSPWAANMPSRIELSGFAEYDYYDFGTRFKYVIATVAAHSVLSTSENKERVRSRIVTCGRFTRQWSPSTARPERYPKRSVGAQSRCKGLHPLAPAAMAGASSGKTKSPRVDCRAIPSRLQP